MDDHRQVSDFNYHLDSILDELGAFGKYQTLNLVLLALTIALNAGYTTSFVFTAADTPHRCRIDECDSQDPQVEEPWLENAVPFVNGLYERCTRYIPNNTTIHDDTCPRSLFLNSTEYCDKWVYESRDTIIGEFDLGCQDWRVTLPGTVNNIGQLIAMPISGFISDKYGRKIVVVAGTVLSAITGIIRSFSQEYWTFIALEIIDPLLGSGVYSAVFILAMELINKSNRAMGSTIIASFYGLGQVLLGLLGLAFNNWRTLLRIFYAPGLLVIAYHWIIPESVTWLTNKGRNKEAGDTIKKAARINGVTLSKKSLEIIEDARNVQEAAATVSECENKIYMKDILKSYALVVRIVVCSFWWITCTFVYYGLSLNSVSIDGNIYLNFIFICLIELPAYAIYYITVDRFGRRTNLCVFFIGSGLSCLAFIFIPDDIFWLKFSFYLFGKFCITIAFTVLYIYTAEIFPTPLRHSLMGICSMVGRIGSIIAPQSPLLDKIWVHLPLILFAMTSLISGVTILFFPETINKKLPDTIEECLDIEKKEKSDPNTI